MNTECDHGCRVAFIVTTLALAILGGCNDKGEQEKRRGNEPPPKSVTASAIGPGASAVPSTASVPATPAGFGSASAVTAIPACGPDPPLAPPFFFDFFFAMTTHRSGGT